MLVSRSDSSEHQSFSVSAKGVLEKPCQLRVSVGYKLAFFGVTSPSLLLVLTQNLDAVAKRKKRLINIRPLKPVFVLHSVVFVFLLTSSQIDEREFGVHRGT